MCNLLLSAVVFTPPTGQVHYNQQGRKNASVSNGHKLLEVAHTNVSPQIPSFKSNGAIKAADCFLDCWNADWSVPTPVNCLSRGNLASISSN